MKEKELAEAMASREWARMEWKAIRVATTGNRQ